MSLNGRVLKRQCYNDDLTGRRFGSWTVIGRAPQRGRNLYWSVRCDCGTVRDHTPSCLIRGKSTRCFDCVRARLDALLTPGAQFGRLTVIERLPSRRSVAWVRCKCSCGTDRAFNASRIVTGQTRSCGCQTRRHGLSYTSIHSIWCSMRKRCSNPNDQAYPNYGGRGIGVCERWNVFEKFYEDMGPRPAGLTLERVDVNGHYEPGNVVWASYGAQNRNRRDNKRYTYQGETLCLADWAARIGIRTGTLWRRLRHWSLERALTEPLGPSRRHAVKTSSPQKA